MGALFITHCAATEAMADSGFRVTEEGKFPASWQRCWYLHQRGIGRFLAIEREHSKL